MPPPSQHEGLRLLRRYHEATLAFGDRRAAVKFIFDSANGSLVMPVEPAAARFSDVVLHLPDEIVGTVQVMAAAKAIPRPESSEACDRWAAYHLHKPKVAVWIAATPEGAKTDSAVYPGEELVGANPLRAEEPRLLKSINADPASLAVACRRIAQVEVADPLAVGIDPDGIDVRARFGIVRLEFPTSAASADNARDLIAGILRVPNP